MANNLVNIPLPPSPAAGPPTPGAPIPPGNLPVGRQVGVFVTPQSLFTFPAASSVVTMIWNLSMVMFPNLVGPYKNWVLLVISLLIGLLMFYLSETEGQDRRAKITGLAVALINSLVLAATALGVSQATTLPGAKGTQ